MAHFLGVKRPGRTADHLQLVQGLRMSGAVLPSAHTSSCCLYGQICIVLAPQWHVASSGCGVLETALDFEEMRWRSED